jgi:hypothetical protein
MNPESLFAVALDINPPWEVEGIEFSQESKRLDIKIGFSRGATFACPVCGAASPAYDTKEKTGPLRGTGTSEGDRHLLMKGWPLVERDRQLFKLQKVVSP